MAPAVQLPIPEMSDLPDLHTTTSLSKQKRWADMVDVCTPSPWPDEIHADFKLGFSLPDTPTPYDSLEPKCFASTKKATPPTADQTCYPAAEMATMISAPVGMTFPVFAQTCPVAEVAIANPSTAVVGMQMQTMPSVYPHSCPASTEMPGHCVVVGSNGLPLQQGLPQMCQSVAMAELPAQGWTCPAVEMSDMSLHYDWYTQPSQMSKALGDFAEMKEWREACHNIDGVAYSGGACAVEMQWPCSGSGMIAIEPAPGQWKGCAEEMQTQSEQKACETSSSETSSLEQQSLEHESGQCKPCAWFWRPQGCRNGNACQYCHLCPEGELKSRKRNKIAAMKMGALTPVKAQAGNGWSLKLDCLLNQEAS